MGWKGGERTGVLRLYMHSYSQSEFRRLQREQKQTVFADTHAPGDMALHETVQLPATLSAQGCR